MMRSARAVMHRTVAAAIRTAAAMKSRYVVDGSKLSCFSQFIYAK